MFWESQENLRGLKEEAAKPDDRVMYISCLAIGAIGFIMAFVNVAVKSYIMALSTGGIGLWMVFTFVLARRKRKSALVMWSTFACMTVTLLYYMVNGGEHGFSIVWLFLVPPAGMYFFSLYYGGIFSLFLGVCLAVYMWTPLHEVGYPYSETYLERMPLVYIAEMIMCAISQYQIVSARLRQQELLEKANAANQAKGDFLANMSHEIRTPMNAIMGMCSLVLDEELSEEARDNCNNIYLSGKNLLGIINDILDFSKIESGKVELTCENYQLSSVLNDVINMAMARKGDKPIEFMVDCDPTIPDRLYGDEIRIRQVLINLLTNAIKFTNEGGVLLQVSARRESYGVNLHFKIKDSGIGIKEENLHKIFSSFSRVDTRRNRAIEGTGLGLPIAKRLIMQMGGFIQVDSEYGKGTEFSVVIPQKVTGDEPIIEVKECAGKKILCYIGFGKFRHPFMAEHYRKIIAHIGDRLKLDYTLCDTIEKTKEALESDMEYTHLFLAREEFLANREYFAGVADRMHVVIVQERKNHVQAQKNIRTIYKPFYVLPVGNVLNGERLKFVAGSDHVSAKRFVAPEARILVVDDNEMNLKVALGLMKPYHMMLYTAESGKQAIEQVKKQRFDLIFMDHMMPEMDGVEAEKLIRSMEGDYYKTVPIIALTANAISGAREMFLREGFQDFVTKPIELSSLERALRRWLPDRLIQHEKEGEEG